MRAVAVVIAGLAVFVALAGTASAVEIDRDFHESFDVKEGFRLSLHTGDGDVTITPWEKDVIDVTVRFRADVTHVGVGGPPDFDVEFKDGQDFVRVIGRMLPMGPAVFSSRRIHEYTYTVKAPPYVLLEIDGDDGDLEVTGWRADIDCALDDGDAIFRDVENSRTNIAFADGDITATDLRCDLALAGDDGDVILTGCTLGMARLSIEDGDITAIDCSGRFAVAVDDGDVSLSLLTCPSVRLRSSDGDADISVAGGDVDEIDVATDDGDVRVSMPSGSSYSFLITMDDGRVTVNVPDRGEYEKDEHAASGKVRGGKGRVRVRTNDGNVLLEER